MQTNYDPPVPVVTINGGVVSTPGSLTTVSGAPKSAKTAFCNGLLAGGISTDGKYDGFDGVEVLPNPEGKAVIHFDTEQSRHKQQKNLRVILKRLGLTECPAHFLSYNLKSVDLKDYKKTVVSILREASKAFGGIHLIVIDGGADFILAVNDPTSSTELVRFFEGLADEYDVVLILIIHTNPGSTKERGHLGSQLQRKGESVISIIKDGDISYLEPRFLREASNSDIPPLQIRFDKDKGYHVSCGVRSNKVSFDKLTITDDPARAKEDLNTRILALKNEGHSHSKIAEKLLEQGAKVSRSKIGNVCKNNRPSIQNPIVEKMDGQAA